VTSANYLPALGPVADALERLGVTYHVGGSVASSQHGKGRSTLDVDVVADLRQVHVPPLVMALADDYYIDEGAIREALRLRRAFNVIHLATMMKVDVFVAGVSPFDREELGRAQIRALGKNWAGLRYGL
jgi:hypothetical protein